MKESIAEFENTTPSTVYIFKKGDKFILENCLGDELFTFSQKEGLIIAQNIINSITKDLL